MSLHIRVAYNKCDGLLRLPFRDFHLSLDGVPQRTFRRRILVPNPIRPSDICSSSMSGSQRGWLRTCSTAQNRQTTPTGRSMAVETSTGMNDLLRRR
jgi:hypothetical protein